MGLFKAAPEAPTAIDLAERDPEKPVAENLEQVVSGDEHLGHHVVDAAMEKRVVRKMDRHLVPLVMALYLLSFLDRSNIGNAKIAGMSEDLELKGNRYSWLLTIFYIGYVLGQFQIIFWKQLPPHIFGTYAIFAWGILATCQAAVQSWGGEMALRFLLGFSEAAYGPGIPYLLTFFYLRHEVGTRIGVFLAAAPLATCFAGALAYGITSGHADIANWRLLFLVEGLPTICMAAVTFFFLPDTPHQARFLNEDEKRVALARGVRQTGTPDRIGGVSLKDVLDTFADPKPWFTALMYFSCNVSPKLHAISAISTDDATFNRSHSPLYQSFCPPSSSKWALPASTPKVSQHHHTLSASSLPFVSPTTPLHLYPPLTNVPSHGLDCRQDPTTRPRHHLLLRRWRHRLHPPRNLQRRRAPLLWLLPRRSRRLSLYCQHPPLGFK